MAEQAKNGVSPGEEPKSRSPKRRRRRPRRKGSGQTSQQPQQGASKETPSQPAPKAAKREGQRAKPAATQAPERRDRKKRKPTGGKKPTSKKRRAPSLPTQREVSAGGVVYRRTGDGIEVVLASRRTRRGDLAWGLAKGGIEEGESREEAAVREVREETGLLAEIEADLGDTKYIYVWEDVRIRKTVHFYLMRHVGGNVEDRDDEMEEIRWFPLERAIKRAAYRGERDILSKASGMLG